MKRKKVKSLTLSLEILLILFLLLTACRDNNLSLSPGSMKYDYKYYSNYTYVFVDKFTHKKNEQKTFSFKYPKGWIIEKEPAWEASTEKESSPEWGVVVYKDNDRENRIGIYGVVSPSYGNQIKEDKSYIKSDLIVDNFKKGEVYSKIRDDKIELYVFYESSSNIYPLFAVAALDKDFYKKFRNEIWHIIASVQ
ncbi:hypothetical protein ELD05_04475 [Caldicellulosiruptor changbaiensis]|uniref:Lipoprotein n=1 Tax=Caldicellulosiruptor changbaiensis TaxID=1222016 RepID=A0A3T0D4J1_9FIRM|nr:hypothetical protein [Caldicellulosiruptor changbaiensis]AZT89966.1 hypothetical protein ELD05_04475 [Caldicellulosiruptor changbaiensis]